MNVQYSTSSQRIAVTAPKPNCQAPRIEAPLGQAHEQLSEAGNQNCPVDEVVRVVPPPDRVVEVEGVARGVDEEREADEDVEDVRIRNPRRRPVNHHATGTTRIASGYTIARPVIAFPANCGRSGRATARISSETTATFTATSSTSSVRA
jgi:hypothetical protein